MLEREKSGNVLSYETSPIRDVTRRKCIARAQFGGCWLQLGRRVTLAEVWERQTNTLCADAAAFVRCFAVVPRADGEAKQSQKVALG